MNGNIRFYIIEGAKLALIAVVIYAILHGELFI